MSKDYEMPQAHRGQTVLWYEGGVKNHDQSFPAIVKVEGYSSLHLYVFGDRPFDMDCVHHIADPNLKEGERTTQGAWDFTAVGPHNPPPVKKV